MTRSQANACFGSRWKPARHAPKTISDCAGSTTRTIVFVTLCLVAAPQVAFGQSPVEILGVSDGDRRDAIRAILPERERPETAFDAERISEEAAERIRVWLRSEGYYAGAASPSARSDPPRAAVQVEFGEAYEFTSPRVEYPPGAAPPPEVREQVLRVVRAIEPGQRAEAAVVLATEAAVVSLLQELGYPEAASGERLAVVDHAARTMTVTLRLEPGERAYLGAVRVAEGERLRPEYLGKLRDWREGEPYSPSELLSLRRDLNQTGAFAGVGVELAPPGGDGLSDVVVTLEPAKPYQIGLGASYSTTEGGGGTAEFIIRNITRRADELGLTLVAAEQQQSLTANWRRPNAIGRGRTLSILGEAIHQDILPFERTGVRVAAAFEPRERVRLASSFGGEISADAFAETDGGVDNALAFSVFAGVRYDTTDDPLDPMRGIVLEAREAPTVSTGDATLLFASSTASASGYISPAGRTFTLAGRLNLGWVQPLAGSPDRIPLNRLFYAGGGGSVRGYQFRSIFPSAGLNLDEPPGGQGLLEASVEGRLRFTSRLGAAVFVDSGAAFNNFGEIQPVYGVGAGLRYDLGFGPLRIDLATPLSDAPDARSVAFYFSLGQAF